MSGEADERTTLLTDPVASSGSLQWAPSNVIDVAALRPNCMEPNEYLEKKNFYKTRLSSFLNSPWPAPGTPRKYILRDIPDPERVLSSEPVSKNNYIMVKLIILGIFKNPIIRTRESQYSKLHSGSRFLDDYNACPNGGRVGESARATVDTDNMWFQQDGATTHTARISLNFLRRIFPGRVISRHGDVPWPPRSPDLTPSDFFLWGYLKSKVYVDKPRTIQELKQSITQETVGIPDDMVERVMRNFGERLQECITER
ncbi:unnamed protein product, partial [Nesidiocoris tenuis]